MTINEIIKEINERLEENLQKPIIQKDTYGRKFDTENGMKFYNVSDIRLMMSNHLDFTLHTPRGIYVHSTETKYDLPESNTFCIKAKRKKVDAYDSWDHTQYMTIVSIELITKDVGEMTAGELCKSIRNKGLKKYNDKRRAEKELYQSVMTRLEKHGITPEELESLYADYCKIGASRFGDPKYEQRLAQV